MGQRHAWSRGPGLETLAQAGLSVTTHAPESLLSSAPQWGCVLLELRGSVLKQCCYRTVPAYLSSLRAVYQGRVSLDVRFGGDTWGSPYQSPPSTYLVAAIEEPCTIPRHLQGPRL